MGERTEPSQVLVWDGPTAHGVRAGFYANLPGPRQTAILECLCGEEITGQTDSWEDAGREMDEHLKTVGPQGG